MPDEVELQLAVTSELKEVRKHGLDKIDEFNKKTGQLRAAPTPHLARAARRIPGYTDRLTRSAAIELLLRHEIPLMTAHPSREWLPSSFGLTEETHGKPSKQRRTAALTLFGSNNRTQFERSDGGDEVKAIGLLAGQIVRDCFTAYSQEDDGTGAAPVHAPLQTVESSTGQLDDHTETSTPPQPGYSHNTQPQSEQQKASRLRRSVLAGAVLLTAGGSIGITASLAATLSHVGATQANGDGPKVAVTSSARGIPDTTPRPASSSNEPVSVESVTPLTHDGTALFYALPEKLDMSPAEIDAFNATASNTDDFDAWLKLHKAVLLGNATTTITLVGNVKDNPVTITDLKVVRQCHAPSEATILAALGGGDSGGTLPLSIDLDKQVPYAQQPDGSRYFEYHPVSLAYNQQITLAVGVHTTQECSFTLQLVVATLNGAITKTIDDNGKPFELTSWRDPHHGYSAYQEVYMEALDDMPRVWKKVDPKTLP